MHAAKRPRPDLRWEDDLYGVGSRCHLRYGRHERPDAPPPRRRRRRPAPTRPHIALGCGPSGCALAPEHTACLSHRHTYRLSQHSCSLELPFISLILRQASCLHMIDMSPRSRRVKACRLPRPHPRSHCSGSIVTCKRIRYRASAVGFQTRAISTSGMSLSLARKIRSMKVVFSRQGCPFPPNILYYLRR